MFTSIFIIFDENKYCKVLITNDSIYWTVLMIIMMIIMMIIINQINEDNNK